MGFPCSTSGKESASNAGDPSSIPGCGISAGEGNSYSLQYFGLLKVHGQYSPWNVYIHCCIFYSFGQNMSCFHHYSIIQSNFLCVCVCARACVHAHTHAHILHRVWLFATSWTVAHQAPLSMGFSRQKYCSGLPIPSPKDHLTQGTNMNPMSPALAASFYFASIKIPCAPSVHPLAPYLTPGNHCIFTVSIILTFLESHLVEIIKYVVFSNWLLSLNDMH